MNNTVAIIQARMGSSRLPGKVLRRIHGIPMLGYVYARVSSAKRVNKVIVVTSEEAQDDPITEILPADMVVRGDEKDVLSRYQKALDYLRFEQMYFPDAVVRITADCPLVDPGLIDFCIDHFYLWGAEWAKLGPYYPEGFGVEVLSPSVLEAANALATADYDREHVTPFVYKKGIPFSGTVLCPKKDYSHFRLCVDYEEDLLVVGDVLESLGWRARFDDIMTYLEENPQVVAINAAYVKGR